MSRCVIITGASSGIGEALALEFARRGCALALLARNAGRLEDVATRARAAGAPAVCTRVLDVRDFHAIEPALRACAAELGGIDCVVANAGLGHVQAVGTGDVSNLIETLDVDLTGTCVTVDAAVRIFRERGRGQVVAISSVARYRALERLVAYSAAKEGLHRFMQGVRAECSDLDIRVTELAPGYIDTPLNRDNPSRPFLIDAATGARIMADLIERGTPYANVPRWPWTLLGPVLRVLPRALLGPRGSRRGK